MDTSSDYVEQPRTEEMKRMMLGATIELARRERVAHSRHLWVSMFGAIVGLVNLALIVAKGLWPKL